MPSVKENCKDISDIKIEISALKSEHSNCHKKVNILVDDLSAIKRGLDQIKWLCIGGLITAILYTIGIKEFIVGVLR